MINCMSWASGGGRMSGALALLVLAGCGAVPGAVAPPVAEPVVVAPPVLSEPKPAPKGAEIVGVASWYGKWHHGKKTASGAKFDRHALTAAHKSLKLGTKVEVTNLANRQSVVLLINDRGPYVRGRVLDVSEGAAKKLGFHAKGLARVRIRVLPA
jgi:rare lipoprotein A